ncbi:bifunctional diguanylate cyclase/phosphodiesterase [Noviherbaspirillum aerium]|uniref:bifunctional diguanylate cyclase/phosphodiesterase n=1 Tax=Noviherbaspirillum aerium TaxID=2588497 RepID=UPI00178C4AB4|nr:EAL domain-containing protein [Noviherbaspirillum aerium]
MLPIISLVLAVIAWSSLLFNLQTKEDQAIQEIYARTDGLAQNYAERLDRTIDAFNRILLHVRHDWALSEGKTRLEDAEKAGIFPRDAVIMVSIFDDNGNVLTTSHPIASQYTVSDRPYFRFHRDVNEDHLLVGQPMVGRFSNKEVILLSRRLNPDSLSFQGIVVGGISPSFLTANYSEAAFGEYGYLGVLGVDKQIRVARIGHEVTAIQHAYPVTTFFPDAESERGATWLDGKYWFADQRNRFVAWRKVKGTQLIAAVGLDEQEALANFHYERSEVLRNAYLNTFGLAIFTLMAMALAYVLLKKKSDLESARIAYRAATEEGVDGFYINRPLRDKDGEIYDYLVVDCNNRGAEIFKLKRNELIGRAISDFYEGAVKKAAFARLQEALEKGVHESEVKVSVRDRLNADWIHYKAVRSGDDLAVTIRDISESKAHLQELERRGNQDALTGLPNRHWIQNYLPIAIRQAKESHTEIALLFIDIDGFKAVNDALGHTAGDDLLKMIASRLKRTVRPQDHVVRLGGDEYVILVEEAGGQEEIKRVAERVLHVFNERFQISRQFHTVGASIGVSVYPHDGTDAETLLKNADIAMYAVKKEGKGNYQFYHSRFYEALKSRLNQEIDLRHALESDEFEMYYQPRVNIHDLSISSMEALVRWKHPTRGIINPIEFIPLAETTGLILPLGSLIIEKVCQQLAAWARAGESIVPVSINVSPRQFNESNMLDVFTSMLKRYSVEPDWIQIEITESMMMQETDEDASVLSCLREKGIKLCLDDFGTGYSSLSQLQKLDFDVLKIDRAFTAKIENEEGRILVTAMIMMAHSLGMVVVAEGVESEAQMKSLNELKCDEAQGYLISKPMPAHLIQSFSNKVSMRQRS